MRSAVPLSLNTTHLEESRNKTRQIFKNREINMEFVQHRQILAHVTDLNRGENAWSRY